jgi:hypothetical protein
MSKHACLGLSAVVLVAVTAAIGGTKLAAQVSDPRLTVADVEKVTGMKGVQVVAPGSVAGAGPGLNFAGPNRKMIVMVNFGTADLYRRAKEQKDLKVGSMTIPMPLFHAAVPGIGDEAFDSPPGPVQYVLYLRKGQKAASLTTYVLDPKATKTVLTIEQLKQLGAIVASRL